MQGQDIQLVNTTDLVVDTHYAIGDVKGNVLFSELRLGPYVIPSQGNATVSVIASGSLLTESHSIHQRYKRELYSLQSQCYFLMHRRSRVCRKARKVSSAWLSRPRKSTPQCEIRGAPRPPTSSRGAPCPTSSPRVPPHPGTLILSLDVPPSTAPSRTTISSSGSTSRAPRRSPTRRSSSESTINIGRSRWMG